MRTSWIARLALVFSAPLWMAATCQGPGDKPVGGGKQPEGESCGCDEETKKVLCLDVYVLARDTAGGGATAGGVNTVLEGGRIGAADLTFPAGALGAGATTSASTGLGAPGDALRSALSRMMRGLNRAYNPCCVRIDLRHARVTRASQATVGGGHTLADWMGADGAVDGARQLGGQSVLDAFEAFVDGQTDDNACLKMLMVEDYQRGGELGRAQDNGDHSIVPLGTATHPDAFATVAVHEIGHNLGLPDVPGAPTADSFDPMHGTIPVPGPGRRWRPRFPDATCTRLRQNVANRGRNHAPASDRPCTEASPDPFPTPVTGPGPVEGEPLRPVPPGDGVERGECAEPMTMTCVNGCPGGMCCADRETPAGWIPCARLCDRGTRWCP